MLSLHSIQKISNDGGTAKRFKKRDNSLDIIIIVMPENYISTLISIML